MPPQPPRRPQSSSNPAPSRTPSRRLTPLEVLQRLQHRVEKRMAALQRIKLEGFDMVISELQVELDFLRRASNYLADRD